MGLFIGIGGVLCALLFLLAVLIMYRELLKLFYNSKFYKKLEKEANEALKQLVLELRQMEENDEK